MLGAIVFWGQLKHVRLSIEDTEPTAHVPHVVLPLTVETEPAGHTAQTPSASVSLYVPG